MKLNTKPLHRLHIYTYNYITPIFMSQTWETSEIFMDEYAIVGYANLYGFS